MPTISDPTPSHSISTGPANESTQTVTFTVTNDNNALFSAQPAVGSDGTLTYTPAANANGAANVSVSVKDNGGTANGGTDTSAPQTFTITVNAVNDAPSFTSGGNVTVADDSGAYSTASASGISSGPSDESGQTVAFHVSNNNNALFSAQPSISSSGTLTFTPAADANGSATVSVYAQDSGGVSNGGSDTSATQTFTITVTEVNDAPTASNDSKSVAEDGVMTFPASDLTANDSKGPANESGQALTVTAVGTALHGSVSLIGANITYTPAANYNGPDSFTYTVTDSGTTNGANDFKSATATVNINVTAVDDAPVANVLSSQTTQYSDPIMTVSVAATDIDSPTLSATTSWKKDTDATYQNGLPADLTFTAGGCSGGGTLSGGVYSPPTACGWSLSGRMMVATGTYLVRFSISDGEAVTTVDVTIIVNSEDARATYTGATFVSTGSATSSTASVTLSATILDATAAGLDPYAGDIRKATVKFVNRDDHDALLCSAPGVGLVSNSDTTIGTATCNWSPDIGTADSKNFTIGIVVGGYYVRNSSADNGVVTVSKSLDGFITGGGYLKHTSSNGLKAGDVGSRTNFGFNVKYNKSKTNLQGNINAIVRRSESDGVLHVYQIKGNSMTSLGVDTSIKASHPNPTAQFNGKASIQDITDPLNVVPVDGNASLQVVMTDRGEPGSTDSIAITVWNKQGGLWYASNWNGTTTVEQVLDGGNLVVH